MSELPRLVFIADAPTLAGDAYFDAVGQALQATPPGAMMLLERDGGWDIPKTSDHARLQRLERLRTLSHEAACPLIVAGRADLAMACGADGVHLSSRGLSICTVRQAYPNLLISRSCHHHNDLQQAQEMGADWVTLSPLFQPLSKSVTDDLLGVAGFTSMARFHHQLKIFALGGITASCVAAAMKANAYGVACLGSILQSADPNSAVTAILNALTRFPTPVVDGKPCDGI
jgi:thiamine-phosphate pyrophosphorylase